MLFEITCKNCGVIQPLYITKNTETISLAGHAHIDNTDVFITCNNCGNETCLYADPEEKGDSE